MSGPRVLSLPTQATVAIGTPVYWRYLDGREGYGPMSVQQYMRSIWGECWLEACQ